MLASLFAAGTIEAAQALVDTRNEPSKRLLARLGFETVRLIEDADFFKESRSDEIEFAFSRARWLEARPGTREAVAGMR